MRKQKLYSIAEREGYFSLDLPRGAQPVGIYDGRNGLELVAVVNVNAMVDKKKFLIVEEDQIIEGSPPLKLISIGIFSRKDRVYCLYEVK